MTDEENLEASRAMFTSLIERMGEAGFISAIEDAIARQFTQAELDAAVAAERERVLSILDAEVKRGSSLAHVHDKDGAPIYDAATIQACVETIEFCANCIRSEK